MDWCNIAKSLTRCNLIIVCMYVCMSVWCVLIKNIIERNAISNLFGFFFSFICDEKEKESCAWKFDEASRGWF